MIIMIPALVKDQELAMVDWKRLQSYDLIPIKVRVRNERKWDIKRTGHWLPREILPIGARRKKLYMSYYQEKPQETQQEVPLDPKNPKAIALLFDFLKKKHPTKTWYLVDIWVINDREGPFKDRTLHFKLATIQNDSHHKNIKGLKLHKIDNIDALLFEVSPSELEKADNGYADDKCKRKLEPPNPTIKHTPACGLY